MQVDDQLILTLVSNVSEVKTILKEDAKDRVERQARLDRQWDTINERTGRIEDRVYVIENHIQNNKTRMQTIKIVFTSLWAILIGLLTFNWSAVESAWSRMTGS